MPHRCFRTTMRIHLKNKNKTSESIAGTMSNYGFTIPTSGYDSEDRLVSYNRTSGLTQSWSLSEVGDWDSVTTNGTAQSRAHGPSHELTAGAGSSVTTDTKGNITLIPASLRPNAVSLTSTWDMDNRLSTAVTGSTTVSHKYDALGRRVAHTKGSTTTVFVPAGQQTICDYAAAAAPASSTYRYVYASYIDEPVMRWQTSNSSRIYYHRNQQYSVTALTNGSGTILERYAYSAYGVPTITDAAGTPRSSSSYANRYTYTGREWDDVLHQYHYRARMYDAELGRFCSKDPIGYEGSRFNFFKYVDSAPLVAVDPNGLFRMPPKKPTHPPIKPWPERKRCCAGIDYDPLLHCCDGKTTITISSCLVCCREVRRLNPAIDVGTLGFIACCQGRWCTCDTSDIWDRINPIDNPRARRIIKSCIKEHEEMHIKRDNHGPCLCAAVPTRGGVPRREYRKSECRAYHVEYDCLKRNKMDCRGDRTCEAEVDLAIRRVLRNAKSDDHKCYTWYW